MHPLLKELERANDPHDAVEIKPDVVLVSRPGLEFPTLVPAAIASPASPPNLPSEDMKGASAPSLDEALRAENIDKNRAAGGRSSAGTWARRAFMAFLLAPYPSIRGSVSCGGGFAASTTHPIRIFG